MASPEKRNIAQSEMSRRTLLLASAGTAAMPLVVKAAPSAPATLKFAKRLPLPPGDICRMAAAEMSRAFAENRLSPVEALAAVQERVDAVNPHINAFCWRIDKEALAAARASEARWRAGTPLSAIDGIPFSVKDASELAGTPHPWGSRLHLVRSLSEQSEPAVQAVIDAGAVAFAKTTMPETGLYQASVSGLYGSTRNPWNLDKSPGGSSSGAAAATAAYCGPMHLGSDGGGSLRAPAAMCGTVALKVTAHRVPFGNPRAMAPFDKGASGLITRSAADQLVAMKPLLNDAGSGDMPSPRIAYLPNAIFDPGVGPVDADIEPLIERAMARIRKGRDITTVREPIFTGPLIEMATVGGFDRTAERYRDYPPEAMKLMHPLVRQNIEEALAAPPGAGKSAIAAMQPLLEQATARFALLMQGFDFLIMAALQNGSFDVERGWHPRTPTVAGRNYGWSSGPMPHLGWIDQGPPSIVLPCALDRTGVPVALMIVARPDADLALLRFAAALETRLEFPPLFD